MTGVEVRIGINEGRIEVEAEAEAEADIEAETLESGSVWLGSMVTGVGYGSMVTGVARSVSVAAEQSATAARMRVALSIVT
jgi:hypothetical protein